MVALVVLAVFSVALHPLVPAMAAACSYAFVLAWGGFGQADGQFDHLIDVAVDANGFLYATDMKNHRIQKFTTSGDFVRKWGIYGSGSGQFDRPHGLAVAPSGYVYVADTRNHRIQKFTGAGDYVGQWGGQGSGLGQFILPRGVTVGPAGDIYVADTGNHRIQRFTADGTFIAQWGSYGSAQGQFDSPEGVGLDADGFVYVADTGNDRIQKFTPSGAFVARWGSYGAEPGQFNHPVSVTAGGNQGIYVADTANGRVQEFTATGDFLLSWIVPKPVAAAEVGPGLPTGIDLDASGRVYVAETWFNHLQKFEPWPPGVDYIAVQDAMGASGRVINAHLMSTADSLTVYAAGYDACRNYLRDLSVAWTTTGSLELQAGTGISFTFSPSISQTRGTILADDGEGHTGETGPIFVGGDRLCRIYLPYIQKD